jgi:hypothetical protein
MNLLLQPEIANKTCFLCQAIAPESLFPVEMPCPSNIFKASGVHCVPTLEPLNPKPLNGYIFP